MVADEEDDEDLAYALSLSMEGMQDIPAGADGASGASGAGGAGGTGGRLSRSGSAASFLGPLSAVSSTVSEGFSSVLGSMTSLIANAGKQVGMGVRAWVALIRSIPPFPPSLSPGSRWVWGAPSWRSWPPVVF